MKTNMKTIALAVMAGLSLMTFAATESEMPKQPEMPKRTNPAATVSAPDSTKAKQKKRPARRCRTRKAQRGEAVMVTGMVDSAE